MEKKLWDKPELSNIGIEMTESGGKDKNNIDNTWTTYDSEGNPEDHYTYSKKPS